MKTKNLVLTALFSALVFIFTAYFLHIPVGSGGGYVHFGDAFIFLAASMLPFPYALFVGAIGAGLADLVSGAAIWIPFTIIIKPLMALCFSSRGDKLLTAPRNLIAPVLGGIICLIGYYLAEVLLFGSFVAPLASIGGGLVQFVGSMVFYYLIAGVMDARGLKPRLMKK